MRPFDRRPQLISYPDSLGGSLGALTSLLESELSGVFRGGLHLLPPFPSTADRGFAPVCYDRIEPEFGTWSDLEALAATVPLTLDVMVNHISRLSPEFREFARIGRASRHSDMFMRPDKIWPGGEVPASDLRAIFLRKPGHPFLDVLIEETGETEKVWATFGRSERDSDQIDLDWRSPLTIAQYEAWFSGLAAAGAREIRLDAVGYLTKQRGTPCFMVEPDIWDALDTLAGIADRHGLSVLPEIHATPDAVARVVENGYPTYDFLLPGLMLDAFRTGRTERLVGHLDALPVTCVTTLDSHDGIPIQPDLVGTVPTEDLVALTDDLVGRGANVNRILGARERGIEFDAHQVNVTYLDGVGGVDSLAVARAIQLFGPGRPQVYYLGLLGGHNDHAAVERTGEGRSINRTDFDADQARSALSTDAARRQTRVARIRSWHPAFGAEHPEVSAPGSTTVRIRWEQEAHWCQLDADLSAAAARVSMSPVEGLEPGPV